MHRLHFDTDSVAADDREKLVRDTLSQGMVPVELARLGDAREGIELRLDVTSLGPIDLHSMAISSTTSTRGSRLAHDDSPPSVFLEVMLAGSSLLVQEGRQAALTLGGLALVSSREPSVVVNREMTRRRVVRVPVEHLGVPDVVLRRALAVPVSSDVPVAGVLARFVTGLPLLPAQQPAQAEFLGRAAVELVRGLVATLSGGERPARRALEGGLQVQVTDYLRRHWHEHDLTADRLAAVHHISTRQLYRLLAAEGISLGDWVRQRRLEACREELARPGPAALSVAAVGRRWGFPDATNFGRVYRATFGVTPLQWRLLERDS